MPFAALATLGAFTLRRREAFLLVFLVWLGNQIIGSALMHYPWTTSTLGWGLIIGVAAMTGLASARGVVRFATAGSGLARMSALLAAFTAYEFVLFAASAVLPSGPDAFAVTTIGRLFGVNAVALGFFLAADALAGAAGSAVKNTPAIREG